MATNYYTKTIKHSLKTKSVIATSYLMPYDVATAHNPAINLEQYYTFNSESDNYVKPQFLMNPRGENALTEFVYDENENLISYSCNVLRELFVLMRDKLWDEFCYEMVLDVDKEKLSQLLKGLDKIDPAQYQKIDESMRDAFRFYGCLDTIEYNTEKEATKVFVSGDELNLQPVEKHSYLYFLPGCRFIHGYNLADYTLEAVVYPTFVTQSYLSAFVEEISESTYVEGIPSIAEQKQEYLLDLAKFLTEEDLQYIQENTGADDRFYISIKWDADGVIDDIIFHTIPIYKFSS